MSDFPPILTAEQAAELLQCSIRHVQSLAAEGILPANRAPNGRWKFSRDALIKWAAGEMNGEPLISSRDMAHPVSSIFDHFRAGA